MSVFNHTGTISSDETWDIVNDTHNITGNLTISDTKTVTIDHSAGTVQSDLTDISVTGVYFVRVIGKMVCNGTTAKRPVFKSSSASPKSTDWGTIWFNNEDAGNSFTYTDFHHFTGFDFDTNYTAGNADLDKLRFYFCDIAVLYQDAENETFGDFEVYDMRSDSGGMFRIIGAGNVTFGRIYAKDCFVDTIFQCTSTGAAIATMVAAFDMGSRDNRILGGGDGTGTSITITKLWGKGYSYLCANFAAGETCDVNGGRWDSHGNQIYMMHDCTVATVTFDNFDFYCRAYSEFDSGSGGNLNDCFVKYGANPAASGSFDYFHTDSGGTANGTVEVGPNAGPFDGMDSVTNPRSTANYPLSFSAFALSSATANGFTAACTPQCPGETFIAIGKTSVATINNKNDLADYPIWINQGYDEWTDIYGDAKLIDNLTSRSTAIDNLEDGTTYYARAVCITPWGDVYWSSEETISTAVVATTVLGVADVQISSLQIEAIVT